MKFIKTKFKDLVVIKSKVYSKKHRDKCRQILESRYGFKKYN